MPRSNNNCCHKWKKVRRISKSNWITWSKKKKEENYSKSCNKEDNNKSEENSKNKEWDWHNYKNKERR